MPQIHATALVDPRAEIAADVNDRALRMTHRRFGSQVDDVALGEAIEHEGRIGEMGGGAAEAIKLPMGRLRGLRRAKSRIQSAAGPFAPLVEKA